MTTSTVRQASLALTLTVLLAACANTGAPAPTGVDPSSAQTDAVQSAAPEPLLTDAEWAEVDAAFDRLLGDPQALAALPSDAEVAQAEREAAEGPQDAAGVPDSAASLAPQSTSERQRRLAFVDFMIRTPLSNFWSIRQNGAYRRGWYAGFDWSTDGCSGYTRRVPISIIPKALLDLIWYRACTQHDFAYRNWKRFVPVRNLKTQRPDLKRLADQRFLDGMNWTCDLVFAPADWRHPVNKLKRAACRRVATGVYQVVRIIGT
ncbi:phospholipase A2 [Deinococcus apachensis]|uniref:phospholipase A2 n=1 Tax=Deinococcus apachensis TaxID=309886 RepID=UPI0003735FB6|nr:phospholipase A2 [Deinococcus apachensis]